MSTIKNLNKKILNGKQYLNLILLCQHLFTFSIKIKKNKLSKFNKNKNFLLLFNEKFI